MLLFISKRIGQTVPVVLLVSFFVFFVINVIPGDPTLTVLGEFATPEQREIARQQYGFDRPMFVQYLDWLTKTLSGDLGRSLHSNERVWAMLVDRLPVSLELSALALIIALVIGIPAGILAALRRGTPVDHVIGMFSAVALGVPYFWLGVLLILLFAIFFNLLPPSGYVPFTESPFENLKLMILPALTIGLHVAPLIIRQTRASVLQVLSQDYVRTAHAKGLPWSAIVRKHILRNALIPVLTLVGLQLGNMLGGAIVTETIFSTPGLGSLIVAAVSTRDFPVVQSGIFLVVLLVIFVNLITDILYAYVDPRIRQLLIV